MSGAARLGFADIVHRTLVSGLAGLSLYGLYGMYRIHTDTMKAGEEAWAKHLQDERTNQTSSEQFIKDRLVTDSNTTTLKDQIPSHRF